MEGYGQFCPLALAAETVGERWTPLVLRELLKGADRFNDIHRGVPRMSPALLVKRLRMLEKAGILRREAGRYRLTEAGCELAPVVEGLAVWGKQWLPASLSDIHADPDLLMWDLHRGMDCSSMPEAQVVMCFIFGEQPANRRQRWVLAARAGTQYCITDPGFEVDLFVETACTTLVRIWHGDLTLADALARSAVILDGPERLRQLFPAWLRPGPLAGVPRRR